jgi:hypothetical protein
MHDDPLFSPLLCRFTVILPQYGGMRRKWTTTTSGMLAVMRTRIHHSRRTLHWQSESAEEVGAVIRMME